MKREQRHSSALLVLALLVTSVTNGTSFAGNITFVRKSTGNWHQIGGTNHIVGMTVATVNTPESDDISDGLPSVISPLTAEGSDSEDFDTQSAEIEYSGVLDGATDHQPLIDHSVQSEFVSILELTVGTGGPDGVQGNSQHVNDIANGNLDVNIDGDGIQFIDVTFEMDWITGGLQSGDSGFTSSAWINDYAVNIVVNRNGTPVVGMIGSAATGVTYLTLDSYAGGADGSTAGIIGDGTLGNLEIGNHFGLWASDGDVITYQVTISYEYDSAVGNVSNSGEAKAGFTGSGILNWRFSLEDSQLH